MNRVINAIARVEQQIKLANTPAEKMAELDRKLDMTIGEYVVMQERKSLATASGRMTLDEAQSVYSILGNTLETFNSAPLSHKVVVTKLMAELLAN